MRNFIEVVTQMAITTQDEWLRDQLNSVIDTCSRGIYSSEMMWWIFGSRVQNALHKYINEHQLACVDEQWFLKVLSIFSEVHPFVIQQHLDESLKIKS